MNSHCITTEQTQTNRLGATLAEILVAMGIMAIGVSLIASLFPATITQAIRADQLTNSALILHQVRELVKIHAGEPTPTDNLLPPSNGVFPTSWINDSVQVIVTDPLGWHDPDISSTVANRDNYGGTGTGNDIERHNGGFSKAEAFRIVPSSDSWTKELDGFVTAVSASTDTTITFDDELAEEGLQAALDNVNRRIGAGTITNPERPGIRVRVILETINNNEAIKREIFDPADINPAARTITFSPVLSTTAIGAVRVQTLEQRYTWMITSRVRLDSEEDDTVAIGPSDDIVTRKDYLVVYFRRNMTTLSETKYPINIPNKGDLQRFEINWAADEKPILKRGTWVFEPKNGDWYQIQEIESQDENDGTAGTATVILDRDVKIERGTLTGSAPIIRLEPEHLIIPQGVIDVYGL